MAQETKQAKRRRHNRAGDSKVWVHINPIPYTVRKQMRKAQKLRGKA